ncbi:hypothetical protein ACLOJK_012617 [Asimina triloba]
MAISSQNLMLHGRRWGVTYPHRQRQRMSLSSGHDTLWRMPTFVGGIINLTSR